MEFLDIFDNYILLTGLIGWGSAQIIKFFLYALVNHEWDITRIWGDGGMPSGHSATVTSVCFATGLAEGFDSTAFAIAAILAIVVMHDAMGVRRETGKQAKLLNDIMEWFDKNGRHVSPEEQLKEFVGHTPIQVCAGAVLGIIVAVIMDVFVWSI